jgi:hypothetical protein
MSHSGGRETLNASMSKRCTTAEDGPDDNGNRPNDAVERDKNTEITPNLMRPYLTKPVARVAANLGGKSHFGQPLPLEFACPLLAHVRTH